MRKTKPKKRILLPDPKFNDTAVTRFVNMMMLSGKKNTAFAIFYDAVQKVEDKTKENGLDTWKKAMANVMPTVEVKSRRVGGATFQIPTEIRPDRRISLSIKWMINYSRARNEKTMSDRLAGEIIAACRGARVSVTMVPANQTVLGPGTELNRIAEVPMLDFQFGDPPRSTMAIKRATDLVVSVSMLTLTAPFLALAAAMIRFDSPGPVFFRQVRIGRDGDQFTMYKLRTMTADAEEQLDSLIDLDALDEPAFKIANDPRVTRIGKWLRRSSFDEVPQFINVLKGDMSLVGPRPEEEAVVALYDERQRQRLRVKPGLTGPMQVAGRGGLTFEERLALERDYVENLTITGDFRILLRTPRAVIRGEGTF